MRGSINEGVEQQSFFKQTGGDGIKKADRAPAHIPTQETPGSTSGADTGAKAADLRAELIQSHREEWRFFNTLRDEIRACIYDKTYVPETWDFEDTEEVGKDGAVKVVRRNPFDHDKRMSHLRYLVSSYKLMAKGLMTKQEGERRAYGFDYKSQQEDTTQDSEAQRRHREKIKLFLAAVDNAKKLIASAPASGNAQ